MRLLQILSLVILPVSVAQAECGRLSKTDTYEKLNQILDCLELKMSEVQKNVVILMSPEGKDRVAPEKSIAGKEVEDNDIVPDANLITLGQRVRGKIAKPEDRDFYKFRTATQTEKFRVILRKLSSSGFGAIVSVYNEVEEHLADKTTWGDTPVSVLVESKPDSLYYLSVKGDGRGEYELVVREEY